MISSRAVEAQRYPYIFKAFSRLSTHVNYCYYYYYLTSFLEREYALRVKYSSKNNQLHTINTEFNDFNKTIPLRKSKVSV